MYGSSMPIGLISIPDDERDDFVAALKQLDLPDGELVENVPDNPGTVGINLESASDPQWAAERLGQIVDAADQLAGRTFRAIGSGAYWPETGETL
jgi:hypothetical protein